MNGLLAGNFDASRLDAALGILRISFGLSLAWHGINKYRGTNGITGTSNWFSSIGMRLPRLNAHTAACSEIAVGVCFAVGLITPFAATGMIALMLVAIVTVHWKVGFFIFLPNQGWEYCAAIATVAAAIGIAGPGRWSLDHLWSLSTAWGAWSPVLAVAATVAHLSVMWRPTR